MKRCTRCGETKTVDAFYKDKRRSDGLYSWCKTCFNAHGRSAHHRRRRPATAQSMERLHRWKERNAARLAEVNRQAQRQRRGDVDFARILAEYGPVCHICGDDIEDDLEFDHVVPLSRGGAHAEENIRPSHEACNHWKGTRLMSELEQMAERVAS